MPEEIGACTTLEELYVSNNAKFSYFPGSAGHLRMLKELSLSKCPALKMLPSTVAELSSLKELDIRGAKKQVDNDGGERREEGRRRERGERKEGGVSGSSVDWIEIHGMLIG